MALPNPSMDAVPFTALTADFLDKMIANDNALADGSGANATSISAAKFTNPYKFSVYRNAAFTPSGTAVVQFDTKEYDTSSNVDIVTNKGRFTAPVSGFYCFNAQILSSASRGLLMLYKNGAEFRRGADPSGGPAGGFISAACFMAQATAGDYFEIYVNTGSSALTISAHTYNYFQGFLISPL